MLINYINPLANFVTHCMKQGHNRIKEFYNNVLIINKELQKDVQCKTCGLFCIEMFEKFHDCEYIYELINNQVSEIHEVEKDIMNDLIKFAIRQDGFNTNTDKQNKLRSEANEYKNTFDTTGFTAHIRESLKRARQDNISQHNSEQQKQRSIRKLEAFADTTLHMNPNKNQMVAQQEELTYPPKQPRHQKQQSTGKRKLSSSSEEEKQIESLTRHNNNQMRTEQQEESKVVHTKQKSRQRKTPESSDQSSSKRAAVKKVDMTTDFAQLVPILSYTPYTPSSDRKEEKTQIKTTAQVPRVEPLYQNSMRKIYSNRMSGAKR